MNSDRFHVFSQGVRQVFSTWTLLNLSVENGWSGRFSSKKRDELVNEVIAMFQSGRKVDPYDLADFLSHTMESSFSTIVEDESDTEVSELICELYNQCSKGDFSLVERLMSIKKTPLEDCRAQSCILDQDGLNVSDIDTDKEQDDTHPFS